MQCNFDIVLAWRHCKVYWNGNVPSLRAPEKRMQSQISDEIYIVNRYKPHIHRVHKKFYLNCISLKRRGNSWESGCIQIFATQWLMGHSPCKYVKDVCLILKRKIHTGGPGRKEYFWEINISAKTAEFVIYIQNLWIWAVNEEILKIVINICVRFSIYTDAVAS